CSEQRVHDDLPTTSIIMCFVDEVWSALLRSVHSVLSRSPPHLIEEVILVDDFSTKAASQSPMAKQCKWALGLARRVWGAVAGCGTAGSTQSLGGGWHGPQPGHLRPDAALGSAAGTVLTFLDSHVECNCDSELVIWILSLFSYMTVDSFQRGVFTWPMNFGWRQIPQEVVEKNKMKETDIIRCPVMAGGLFAIDKKYFFELGTYDPGLDVWGGENMELSFKVRHCQSPATPGSARVPPPGQPPAPVWLDEYKELFYGHAYHLVLKRLDVGDLAQQIQLRQKLRCRSFRWYLENVYPDLAAPLVKASGLLVNTAAAGCVAVENTTLAFQACDVNNKHQEFNYTWLRLIQHGELCLAPSGATGALGLQRCRAGSHSPTWLHRSLAASQPELTDHIISEHLQQPACLEVDPSHKALRLNACGSANPYQKWHFGNYYAD
ncbi:GALT5 acetylgalactosaminyltransferase, partial [Urocolius indicus]|nr:GALT5 acetylgalactosaminyltransferase [Urocolius indicus]